ncbi:Exonuclease, RNase T/DNA polymerase III [Dillenia turbinata]|uniref:RNA exonuclease 4 n=1 Tax=Dillenia turbinata TaxID=194707 RepID=A0AAN8VHB0_9MAGN
MGNQPKNPKKQQPLNPNWAQLQQKIKSHGNKPSRPSHNSNVETPIGLLGKRKERSNEESEETRINPLTPTSNDFSVTDTIAMDCEMVGVSPEGNKSALGRVTLVNKWGNVIYDEFVRPLERVVDFRTAISGIRPRDMKKGRSSAHFALRVQLMNAATASYPKTLRNSNFLLVSTWPQNFWAVQKKVAELIKGKILVGHALRNDLKALLLSHPKKDVRDTSDYPPFLRNGRRKALRKLATEFLGIEIQNGEHCPIEDARAAMLLYQKNRKEWEKSIKQQRKLQGRQQKNKSRQLLKDSNHSASNHATDDSQHGIPI